MLAAEKRGSRSSSTALPASLTWNIWWLTKSDQQNLPVRFSDQDKDAGRYSQAEQVTWEIIGMLEDFISLALTNTIVFSGQNRA